MKNKLVSVKRALFTRKIQLTFGSLFGFAVWKISTTTTEDGIPKIVPSRIGITIAVFNFILLITCLVIGHADFSTVTSSMFKQDVLAVVFFIYANLSLAIPIVLLISVLLNAFKQKTCVELFYKARRVLEDLEVDADKMSFKYKCLIYGTFVIYIVYIVSRYSIYENVPLKSSNPNNDQSFVFYLIQTIIPFLSFACVFMLTCSTGLAGGRFEMIRQELKQKLANKFN